MLTTNNPGFLSAIGKRVGNGFFVRLNRLEFEFDYGIFLFGIKLVTSTAPVSTALSPVQFQQPQFSFFAENKVIFVKFDNSPRAN